MSRRLRKKVRAGKHTNRSAANLPKLNLNGPDSLLSRGFARKPNVRAALMVGTALTAGVMGVVAEVVVGGSPAMACPTGTDTYTGNLPNGIVCILQPASTTIVTTGTTNIGGNNGYNDGIFLSAGASGLFLGVNTGNATTIGLPTYNTVTHDGIHVYSGYGNTTISINNAGIINIGNGTAGSSNDGISARIESYGNNTISVENTGPIGNATNPVGRYGIYGVIISNNNSTTIVGNVSGTTSTETLYISNTKAIYSHSDGIYGEAKDYANASTVVGNATGGAAHATVTIFNTASITRRLMRALTAIQRPRPMRLLSSAT